MSQSKEGNSQESVAAPDYELENALSTKFPHQGLTGVLTLPCAKALLMWATIYDLAKLGKLEEIRPDILCPHYLQFKAIADSFAAVSSDGEEDNSMVPLTRVNSMSQH